MFDGLNQAWHEFGLPGLLVLALVGWLLVKGFSSNTKGGGKKGGGE